MPPKKRARGIEKTRALIRAIYLNASATVRATDSAGKQELSEAFEVNRGVVQGDIVSPFGFILALQLECDLSATIDQIMALFLKLTPTVPYASKLSGTQTTLRRYPLVSYRPASASPLLLRHPSIAVHCLVIDYRVRQQHMERRRCIKG